MEHIAFIIFLTALITAIITLSIVLVLIVKPIKTGWCNRSGLPESECWCTKCMGEIPE